MTINPFAVISNEKTGLHRLTTIRNIIPYSIITNEFTGIHRLSALAQIRPYPIRSTEIFGLFSPARPDFAIRMAELPIKTTARGEAQEIAEFYKKKVKEIN